MSITIHPFTEVLMSWHSKNARKLPWKKNNDPYNIWLSEIILQQTRVDQGTSYYLRFIERFPNVQSLAGASEDEVLKLWEGLGYYSRARNLHSTAKTIIKKYGGKFPDNYGDILSLKGVGPYTASAISSFAYGLPYAAIDGNAIRVVARYLGIEEDVGLKETKLAIENGSYLFLDTKAPGRYNQAIMDFGATVCVPKNPDCLFCPLQDGCKAYSSGLTSAIPYKSKKVSKKTRFLNYHIFTNNNQVLINKREGVGIWKGLYEFYLQEADSINECPIYKIDQSIEKVIFSFNYKGSLPIVKHILTHQVLLTRFYFYEAVFHKVKDTRAILPFYLVNKEKLSTFAFPRMIQKHILEKNIL